MKEARNSFGKPHQCKFEWPEDCGVQCGEGGLVLDKKGSYTTAFFEAFPKSPSCFLRGEGASIEEVSTIMVENNFSGMPVIEEGNLTGVITKTDLMELIVELEEAN